MLNKPENINAIEAELAKSLAAMKRCKDPAEREALSRTVLNLSKSLGVYLQFFGDMAQSDFLEDMGFEGPEVEDY